MSMNRSLFGVALIVSLTSTMALAQPPATPPTAGEARNAAVKAAVARGELLYYPAKAAKARIKGVAVLDCLAEPDGWVSDCKLVQETPAGWDFGATALSISPLMRLQPGQAGSRARVPVRFNPPKKR